MRPLLTMLLLAAPAAAQDPAPRYEREAGGWVRVDALGRFPLDPEVVSVRFAPGLADLAELRAALPDAPLPRLEVLRENRLGVHDLRITDGTDLLQALALLRATGAFEFAEENGGGGFLELPDDPLFGRQWALRNTGLPSGTPGADVDAEGAWAVSTGDPAVVVAVLDAGVEISHPDLVDNVWVNAGEVPGNGLDDDGNGFVDDVHGWDFNNGDADVTGPFYHGTAVAGAFGARAGNAFGIAGLAGGWGALPGARVMSVQVGDVVPQTAIIDDAILYAVDNGARVLNMSFYSAQTTAINLALAEAWDVRGAFLCAAAGNDGGAVEYPARSDRVVAVPGSDRFDQPSPGSCVGPQNWVAAPSHVILSLTTMGQTAFFSGTSFSSPLVAGTAALLYARLPAASNEALKEILRLTADDVGAPGFDDETGWGRLDAGAALAHADAHDCDGDGAYDPEAIAAGLVPDVDGDGVPDSCQCPPTQTHCLGAPNSVGPGAAMDWSGSTSLSANDLVLRCDGLPPGAPYVLHYGPRGIRLPFGDGWRCVGGGTLRLAAGSASPGGLVTHAFDATSPPHPAGAVAAGEEWSFQCWYADPTGGPSGFNLSDALRVGFCP